MTVEAIKEEIGHPSEQERKQLRDWLEAMEEEAWDQRDRAGLCARRSHGRRLVWSESHVISLVREAAEVQDRDFRQYALFEKNTRRESTIDYR